MAGQAVFTLLLLLGELSADTGIVLRGGKGLRCWLLCSVPPRCGLPWGSLLPPAPWGYTVRGGGGGGGVSVADTAQENPPLGVCWRRSARHSLG